MSHTQFYDTIEEEKRGESRHVSILAFCTHFRMTAQPRVTELSNAFTTTLDALSSLGMVRSLKQADAQVFSGWDEHVSLNDQKMLSTLSSVARVARDITQSHVSGSQRNAIVFSGCGTSGRIAWHSARLLHQIASARHPDRPRLFNYLISGDDQSLVISNELPEDDPHQGEKDLVKLVQGCDRVLFIGVTCGLSAPYVAGQIAYSMHQQHHTTVLMGFNPVSLARNAPIESWDRTCRSTFDELERYAAAGTGSHFVLNPVVGPEPVTGSSRMKGGSATKVMIDTAMFCAISPIFWPSSTVQGDAAFIKSALQSFERAYFEAYQEEEEIARVVAAVGSCMQSAGGHVYYIGTGTFGLMGLVG